MFQDFKWRMLVVCARSSRAARILLTFTPSNRSHIKVDSLLPLAANPAYLERKFRITIMPHIHPKTTPIYQTSVFTFENLNALEHYF